MYENQITVINGSTAVMEMDTDSIQDLLARFIDYVQVRETTIKGYAVCLRCFLEWLDVNGIQHPERTDIQNYVKYLAAPHPRRRRCDRPDSDEGNIITLSAGTQARYLRAVKQFFKWAQYEGLYKNVAEGIKGAKVSNDNQKRDALPKDGAQTLLESIDRSDEAGLRDYAMILLSITAGLRIIELQRANIGNMETINGEHVLFVHGKGHDEADTFKKLTPEVYAAIMAYLDTRDHTEADAPLFASAGNRSRGARLTEPSISRIIKNRLIDAGYDTHRISAHSLRHTSVTFLLKAGATIQEAQMHARHASPETTGIYAHNIDRERDHSEQRIYDFLFDRETDSIEQAVSCLKRMSAEKQKAAVELLQALAG